MTAAVRIGKVDLQVDVECEVPTVKAACQKLIEQSGERIEAAIASAVCDELRRIIPGIRAKVVGISWEDQTD